jgi:hypothetical protein
MCIHSPDNQRGWTGDCPDSARCLCGYFVERGPVFQPRRSTLSTVAGLAVSVGALLLALTALVFWLASEDERRDARLSTLGR